MAISVKQIDAVPCSCTHRWDQHGKPKGGVPWDVCSFPCLLCECAEFVSAEPQQKIITELLERRKEQDVQWGGAEHDDTHSEADWRDYIEKQLNDAANAIAFATWRDRMVDIGALAIAAIEWADRKTEKQ